MPNEFRLWDHEKAANDVFESSMNMLHADYVDAGQMPVVLANKFGGVIFHEACGHLLETTQIERGTTPFENKLNEKIAHKSSMATISSLLAPQINLIHLSFLFLVLIKKFNFQIHPKYNYLMVSIQVFLNPPFQQLSLVYYR